MLRLKSKNSDSINVREMVDGQIAVIVKWTFNDYKGRIVQRHKLDLITLGMCCGEGFPNMFSNSNDLTGCFVRILKNGEILVVENNE